MARKLATAEWADPALVADKYRYRPGCIWLGRSATDDDLPLGYADDRHICLVSGSRGGKGTTSIVNTLLVWPGSVIVIDPKGENATVTAARRGGGTVIPGLGQAVHVLDPFEQAQIDPGLRGRFNPLDALDPSDPLTVNAASRLADALVVVHHETNDPYWDRAARRMIKGLILHVLTAPEYEGRRNLLTVRDLIARGDQESVETLREMGETEIPSAEALLWDQVERNTAFNGAVARIGARFSSLLLNAPKTFEGVIESVSSNFEFLESPSMEECLSGSDFDIDALKTASGGMSLYLCLPEPEMATHHGWLRMMIALIVAQMQIIKGRPATGFPVLVVLDEFAGLDRMKTIEHAVAQIAGAGVKLFFVLQSLEQLKAVYKDNWETFLANAGVKIFFNLEDHFSREYVSKMIGETELSREVHSGSLTKGESESVSQGTSRSVSETEGQSSSRGRTDSRGTNWSNAEGESESSSESWGSGHSFSLGETHTPGLFGSGLFSRMISGSNSQTWSTSRNFGTSKGWNKTRSWGGSQGSSTSLTEGESSSRAVTGGESFSSTKGTSSSMTEGVSETLHRRPLIYPDEIGKYFAAVNDSQLVVYPGLAIVLIAGENPVYLRRTNYYEDPYFIGLFSQHPDHKLRETSWYILPERTFPDETVDIDEITKHLNTPHSLPPTFGYGWEITVPDGAVVQSGQIIGDVFQWPKGFQGQALGGRSRVASLRAPFEGRLQHFRGSTDPAASWAILHYGTGFNLLFANAFGEADEYFRLRAEAYQVKLETRKAEEIPAQIPAVQAVVHRSDVTDILDAAKKPTLFMSGPKPVSLWPGPATTPRIKASPVSRFAGALARLGKILGLRR